MKSKYILVFSKRLTKAFIQLSITTITNKQTYFEANNNTKFVSTSTLRAEPCLSKLLTASVRETLNYQICCTVHKILNFLPKSVELLQCNAKAPFFFSSKK